MRNVVLLFSLLLVSSMLVGCSDSGPTNVVGDANQQALDDYEKALAEVDALTAGDTDMEE